MAEMQAMDTAQDRLAQAAQGDEEAFAELVRSHQGLVYSLAWHFFNDPVVAEDVAQEVFVQLFQNLSAIKSPAHLLFWLRQVTTRKCVDEARRRGRRHEVDFDSALELSSAADEKDHLELEHLRRLVAALPARMRAVVALRYQEDLEPGEIAALLGCPVNSVKSRLQRALALLRGRIERR